MFKFPSVLIVAFAMVLSLSGCNSPSSGSPDQSLLEQGKKDNVPSRDAEAKPMPRSDDPVAEEAFLKTAASGNKSWELKNVVVHYSKTDARTNTVKLEWTKNCTATEPTTVHGMYPLVVFSGSRVVCDRNSDPGELIRFNLLTSEIVYKARHIPALPIEPNQFRLDFESTRSSNYFSWKSISSLNALTKENILFMDLVGEERADIEPRAPNMHYLEVRIVEVADQATKIHSYYKTDERVSNETTEITVTADFVNP